MTRFTLTLLWTALLVESVVNACMDTPPSHYAQIATSVGAVIMSLELLLRSHD